MGDIPKLAWSRDKTGKVDNIHSNLSNLKKQRSCGLQKLRGCGLAVAHLTILKRRCGLAEADLSF